MREVSSANYHVSRRQIGLPAMCHSEERSDEESRCWSAESSPTRDSSLPEPALWFDRLTNRGAEGVAQNDNA